MARGFKTGGRKKGTHNNATAEARLAAQNSGITPLEYMLGVMRDCGADKERRDRMAQAAAPYLHAKVATIESPIVNVNSDPEGIQISFVLPSREANGQDDG